MTGGIPVAGEGRGSRQGPLFPAGVLSLGLYLLVSSLGGLYLGTLLDRSRGACFFAPAGLIAGLFLGFHRAYIFIRSAIRKGKDPDSRRQGDDDR